jgi:hypothetical protein
VKTLPLVACLAALLASGGWAPRIETNRTVMIPFAFAKCEETGRLGNFERATAALRGQPLWDAHPPGYPFDDSDLYKAKQKWQRIPALLDWKAPALVLPPQAQPLCPHCAKPLCWIATLKPP